MLVGAFAVGFVLFALVAPGVHPRQPKRLVRLRLATIVYYAVSLSGLSASAAAAVLSFLVSPWFALPSFLHATHARLCVLCGAYVEQLREDGDGDGHERARHSALVGSEFSA